MSEAIKIISGFLIGLAIFPALVWLVFVQPYSTVSLRGFWWSLLGGSILGLVSLFVVLFLWSSAWPKD